MAKIRVKKSTENLYFDFQYLKECSGQVNLATSLEQLSQ